MRGILTGILLCASNLSVLGSLTPASELPSEVVLSPDVQKYGLIILETTFGDGTAAKLLLDTASPMTIFDDSLAKHLGKKLASPSKIESIAKYSPPALFLNGTKLVFDDPVWTDTLRDLGGKYSDVRGILGFDCLKHYCIQIDPVAGRLRFLNPATLVKNDLGTRHEIILQKYWMQGLPSAPFVHGNLIGDGKSTSLLSTRQRLDGTLYWKTFKKVESSGRLVLIAGGAPGVAMAYKVGSIGSAMYGRTAYTNLLVINNPSVDTIGLHFLVRHIATLDFPGNMLYLKRIDNPTATEIPRFDDELEPDWEPKDHGTGHDAPKK